MVNPKYLYHYTTLDNFKNILKSGTLRLYDIRSQKDPRELEFAADKLFAKLIGYVNNKNRYSKEQIMAILPVMVFVSHKYCSNTDKLVEQFRNIFSFIDNENIFKSIEILLQDMNVDFFISSFSTSKNNLELWENYSDNKQGVVFQIETNHLPKYLGIKPIVYDIPDTKLFETYEDMLYKTICNYSDTTQLTEEITKLITHISLSTKESTFSNENEFRLIDTSININDNNIYIDQNSRKYKQLRMSKLQFFKTIRKVYYSEYMELIHSKRLKSLLNAQKIQSERYTF